MMTVQEAIALLATTANDPVKAIAQYREILAIFPGITAEKAMELAFG